MQDVRGHTETARVLVFETNVERAALITDRFMDHGIDAVFVDKLSDIVKSLRARDCDVLLLNDGVGDSKHVLSICLDLQQIFSRVPDIILATDDKSISLRDCHEAGCAHLVRRTLDFNELCDLIERVAQVSGKRLYDGQQLRLAKRFGPLNRPGPRAKTIQELRLEVQEVARGGFYFESDGSNDFVPREGMLVQFDLSLSMFPDYSFHGKGYISWVRKLASGKLGVGIEFALIPAESEQLLRAFSDLFKIREFIPIPAALEVGEPADSLAA